MKAFNLIAILLLVCACGDRNEQKSTVYAKQHENMKGMISHTVYFNLNDSANAAHFMDELRTLRTIPAVYAMQLGGFKDLKDKRALKEYEVVMEIICATEEDYSHYQEHAVHQALKKAVGPYLAAPPAVYDYIIEE